MRISGKTPSTEGTLIFPGPHGGTNWNNPSFSPRTGLFYVGAWVAYSASFVKRDDDDYAEGQRYMGGFGRSVIQAGATVAPPPTNLRNEQEGYGAIRALDARTGEKKWEFKMNDVTDGGILTTASDLLFSGGREGYFFALDARSGGLLWKVAVGGSVASGPMTYSVGGRQYVAVAAGNSLFTFALRQ
jgi:alcohol dehydrogenase (cytochrome c)